MNRIFKFFKKLFRRGSILDTQSEVDYLHNLNIDHQDKIITPPILEKRIKRGNLPRRLHKYVVQGEIVRARWLIKYRAEREYRKNYYSNLLVQMQNNQAQIAAQQDLNRLGLQASNPFGSISNASNALGGLFNFP